MLTEKTKVFLQAVCQEIRWPAAHASIRAELSSHVAEHAEALMAEGVDAASAEEQAIRAMGNAQEIGRQLDKLHRPKLAWLIIVLGIVLCGVSVGHQLYSEKWGYHLPDTTVWGLIMGIASAVMICRSDYQKWLKCSTILYGAAWALLIAVQLLGMSSSTGPKRLFWRYGFQLVPAVLAVLLVLAMMGIVYQLRHKGRQGLMQGFMLAVLSLVPLVLQDWTLAVIMSVLYVVVFLLMVRWGYFGGRRGGYLLILGMVMAVLLTAGLVMMTEPQWFVQIRETLYPYGEYERRARKTIMNVLQNAQLIGSAEVLKTYVDALTNADHSKYILLCIIHDWGILAGVAVAGGLGALLAYGYSRMARVKELYGRLLGTGALTLLTGQVVLHVLVNLGVYWPANVQLPFFSAGGTNMVMSWLLLGVVLSVWRRSSILSEVEPGARSAEGIDAAATEAE